MTAIVVALASCSSFPTKKQSMSPAEEPAEKMATQVGEATPDQAAIDGSPGAAAPVAAETPTQVVVKPKLEIGTGQFVNQEAASRVPAEGVAGDVTFNFENNPIQAVVKAILGDLLQENYVIAPGVQGNVTFATAKPISPTQARAVLETLLSWNGLAMVYKEGRYTVLPLAQAIPGNLTPRTGPVNSARGYEVRVVPLQYISPTEMEKLLTPYVRQGGIIRADNARSMIVVAGNSSELQSYLETIQVFDVDWLAGMSVGVFPLERVEAKDIVPELDKIFGESGNTPLAGLFRFMPIERLNAILVITPQQKYLEHAQKWIGRLDRGGSDAGTQLYVYYVKNVKAKDLADQLTEVFTGQRKSSDVANKNSSVAGVAPGLEPVEVRTTSTLPQAESSRPKTASVAPVAGDGISLTESEDIRISAVEESNALLVRATPPQYDSIMKAINRLDTVPLQVHIEVKILSVLLNDNLSLGVEWFFENKYSTDATRDYRNLPNRVNRDRGDLRNSWNSYAGQAGSGTGDKAFTGLAWTFLNASAEALLTTLQANGNAQVLSAPSLVVLNNKEASINIGTQLPVVSSFIGGVGTLPTTPDSGSGSNTGGLNPGVGQSYVQFRNTGITLKVTPRVNPGGLVFMEVSQEDSQPLDSDTAVAGNVAVSQRQISTEIAVQSGQTVLLGGLIRDKKTNGRAGVPGLSKIPIIGNLFGRTSKANEREELLVLITPMVIDSIDSAQTVTDEYRERFKGLEPLFKRDEENRKSTN